VRTGAWVRESLVERDEAGLLFEELVLAGD
jgi:hypothetical protein